MKFSTAVKVAAGVLVVGTIALIAAAKSIDKERTKAAMAAAVRAATGRELRVDGSLKLKLGLNPRMVVEDVSLSNATWAAKRPLARAARVEAEIALVPLFGKRIEVRRLAVTQLQLLLETDAQGRGNWEFAPAPVPAPVPVPAPSQPHMPAFDIRELRLEDVSVAYVDRRGGAARAGVIEKLTLRPDRGGGPLSLAASGAVDGTAIQLSGLLGPFAAKPFPLQVKASAPGLTLVADGSLAEPLAGKGIDLRLSAQGDELADALRAAGHSLPPLGPFKLSAQLSDPGGKLKLANLDAALGRKEALRLTARGDVKDLANLAGVELQVAAESDNLAGLSRAAGADLPAIGPLRLAGRLQDLPDGWKLADLKGSLSHNELAGDLALTLGQRPRLAGRLASPAFGFADLAPAKGSAKPGDGRLFPEAQIPVDALRSFDFDLALAAGRLGALGNVEAEIHLKAGRLAVKPATAILAGGSLAGELALDATATPPSAALRVEGRGVELGRLLKEAGTAGVNGGRGDLTVELKGRGASVRTLLADLDGSAVLTVGEGRIEGRAADWAGGDLATQLLGRLNPLLTGDDATQLTCGVMRFTVRDGVATSERGIAAETGKVNVVGSGSIDLRSEALDIGITPRAREGLGLSLAGPLAGVTRLKGTLAQPSLRVDELGTAKAAASVGAAMATGGLSLVGELLFDKVTADAHPCRTALAKAKK